MAGRPQRCWEETQRVHRPGARGPVPRGRRSPGSRPRALIPDSAWTLSLPARREGCCLPPLVHALRRPLEKACGAGGVLQGASACEAKSEKSGQRAGLARRRGGAGSWRAVRSRAAPGGVGISPASPGGPPTALAPRLSSAW